MDNWSFETQPLHCPEFLSLSQLSELEDYERPPPAVDPFADPEEEENSSGEIQAGGNTVNPRQQSSPAKKWVGTWNNYPDDVFDKLDAIVPRITHGIAGREKGAQGTPHLQMAFCFKRKLRLTALKKILPPQIHWEKMRGTWDEARVYCEKEDTTPWEHPPNIRKQALKRFRNVTWKPWQQQIVDLVEEEPHPRTVYWFWEEDGNVGKTFVAEYLTLSEKAYYMSGRSQDIINALKNYSESGKPWRNMALIDIARSESQKDVDYVAIEKLKGNIVFNTKYEAGELIKPIMHVVCLANFPPDSWSLSDDRWVIVQIL